MFCRSRSLVWGGVSSVNAAEAGWQLRRALGEAVPAGAWVRGSCVPGGLQGRVSRSRRGGCWMPFARILRPKPGIPVPGGPRERGLRVSFPAGPTEVEQLVQRCQYETVPFSFASWATSETGTSPVAEACSLASVVEGWSRRIPGLDRPSAEASGWSVAERGSRVCRSNRAVRGCPSSLDAEASRSERAARPCLGAEAPEPGLSPISVRPFRAPPCCRPA